MLSCISIFGAVFFDSECIRVAKSDFEHFGGSISPLFLSVITEIFYIKPLGYALSCASSFQ